VVRNVVAQLRDTGHVTRGWLGVTIQDVDKTLADSFGLDRPKGALVTQLSAEGPADEAGVESGDVIVTFDGKDILTSSDLPHVVGLIRPGTTVTMELIRDKKLRKMKVEVGGLDADQQPAVAGAADSGAGGGRLGIVVSEPPEDMLERWGISGGVLVRDVAPDSVAADAGVIAGDVITMIGSTPVKSVAALGKAVKSLEPGSSVPLRLIRRGSPLFIGLKLRD
jgi:serine protease Do